MKILAIDTSAKTATAALTDGRRLLSLYTQNVGLTHSETMLPMVEALLRDAKTDVDEIDMFACAVGPGSFTGVRIGVSLVKGLAFGKNKICVGISTLESLARNIEIDGALIVPVMDARRERLYSAVFKYESGKYLRLKNDDANPVDKIAEEISKYGGDIYFVGDGYDIIGKAVEIKNKTPEALRLPSGYSAALAALDKYESAPEEERKNFTDALLSPDYLRPSQAERILTSKGVVL